MNMVFNLESLMHRLGENKELVYELLNLFIDTIPEQIDFLRSAIDKKDKELIRQKAHALKGSAGNISAEKLAAIAASLEISGKIGNFKDSELEFLILQKEYTELELLIRQELKTL